MSYCRYSSDNWTSDVYVYESSDGYWQIHVAASRYVDIPKVTVGHKHPDWLEQYQKQTKALRSAELVPIGLPFDGKSYQVPSPGECAFRLQVLKDAGYHVPDGVIEALNEEQVDMDGG